MRPLALLLAGLAVAGCAKDTVPKKAGVLVEDDKRASVDIIGVSPADFDCDSVATEAAVTAALGLSVSKTTSDQPSPVGVPRPCVYTTADPVSPIEWSFDIDCRENAVAQGESLMVSYSSQPGAQPVRVGTSGIDAANSVLLFIDDDAPCYVRVLGPDADKRAALAQIVAGNLAPRTAPGKVSYR
jgi:hypothetical protein